MLMRPPLRERFKQDRRNAAALLEGCRKRHAAHDKTALLEAINWCAIFGVRIPAWAAGAFCDVYLRVTWDFEHASWNDVFGRPHSRRKLRQLRQEHDLDWAVYWRVRELRAKKPKPQNIFALVGDSFTPKLEASTVKRYWDARCHWLKEAWASVQKIEE